MRGDSALYTFEARIQTRPSAAGDCEAIALRGCGYRTLGIRPAMLAASVFPLTFEQAEAALAALPRMFIEPDGSFVWVADGGERSWQLDGQMYDRDGHVLYVEVKGNCPADAFDRLLRAFGWPDVPLVFQLIREAVYLDEAGFRRYAATSAVESEGQPLFISDTVSVAPNAQEEPLIG